MHALVSLFVATLPTPEGSVQAPSPLVYQRTSIVVPDEWPSSVGASLRAKLRRDPDGPHRVLVEGLSAQDLEAAGARVRATVGSIASVDAGRGPLLTISKRARRVDLPRSLRPTLDKSRALVGAEAADFADGFEAPLRGQGVLIGTYDSGVDLLHPDFWTLDGKPRVIHSFDQSSGSECDRAQIAERRCNEDDPTGHGTLTLSVAMGSGPRYRGVAPEAEAIVVRSDAFDDLVGALAHMKEIALAEKKPLVVNLSLGGHSGPHDGTSIEAAAITSFGSLVVAAAGNDGQEPIHAKGSLDDGAKKLVLKLNEGSDRGSIEVWGSKEGSVLPEVQLVDASGVVVARSGTVTAGSGRTDFLTVGGATVLTVDVDASEPSVANGRPSARVAFEVDFAELAALKVVVELSGRGSFDAWTDAPADVPEVPRFETTATLGSSQILGDSLATLSDPATAPGSIAVTSYQSRSEAPTSDSGPPGIEGPISSFSARGPTLDEAKTGPKPDLAAPGEIVVAARAKRGSAIGAIGPLYRAAAGTSLAAPHVAGAAAVLLSARSDADSATVRAWLLASAASEDDPRFGRGRLALEEALALAGQGGCGCRASSEQATTALWVLGIGLVRARRRRTNERRARSADSPATPAA
ncbi:MAG: S8 family serine peptidase [Deltaproteobacteria bacterium]|nr:S8 family serine peptidase [Deltaproteobacteria bacterium]